MILEDDFIDPKNKDYILCPADQRDNFFLCLEAVLLAEALAETSLCLVVFFGGTGSGKSSLLNFLADCRISPVSVIRPCTTKPYFVAPSSVAERLDELLQRFIGRNNFHLEALDLDGMSHLVLVDCPDYDSISAENRRQADFLFMLSDLICLVLSPVKYADESAVYWWERIKQEKNSSLILLTKMDSLSLSAVEEVRCSVDALFNQTEPLFISTLKPADGLRKRLLAKLKNLSTDILRNEIRTARKNRLKTLFHDLSLICLEEYNTRNYYLRELEQQLQQIAEGFYERLQVLQKGMLPELKGELKRIADDKVFSTSRWLTKKIGSLFRKKAAQPLAGLLTEQNSDDKWSQEIMKNMLLALEQSWDKLEVFQARHPWFQMIQSDKNFADDFLNDCQKMMAQAKEDVLAIFKRNVSKKHSIIAVSQEFSFSIAVYIILGPIAILPGWDQFFSGLIYFLHGQAPIDFVYSSVKREIEQLSDEYQRNFKLFLDKYLQRIRMPVLSFDLAHTKGRQEWENWCAEMERFLSS